MTRLAYLALGIFAGVVDLAVSSEPGPAKAIRMEVTEA